MLLFLDTECTGSSDWTREPKLMSLALVTEDRHREFYIELADRWQIDDCSEFVKREVVPLLEGPRRSSAESRDELRPWFAHAPRETEAACALQSIFGFCWVFLASLCLSTCHGPIRSSPASRYEYLRPRGSDSIRM
jgi:hypothetical protein